MRNILLCIVVVGFCAGQMCTPVPSTDQGQESDDELIYTNTNDKLVLSSPFSDTTFTLDQSYTITKIRTYHWDYGEGTSSPGTISLKSSGGTTYGPWSATGVSGQGGVPNAYWDCFPIVELGADTYTVVDSDNSTWSHNADTGYVGIVWVYGNKSGTTPTGGLDPVAVAKSCKKIYVGFRGMHYYNRSDMTELYHWSEIAINSNWTQIFGIFESPIIWTGNTFRTTYSGNTIFNDDPVTLYIEISGTLSADGLSISNWEALKEEIVDYGSYGKRTVREHLVGSGKALPHGHTFSESVKYQILVSTASSYLQTVEDSQIQTGVDPFQSTYSHTDYNSTEKEPWLTIIFEN